MDINQLNKLKKSKGSTMVMALVAVAFVSIIATVCLYAASANVARKGQNMRNKKNFYTAESIVEEVYSGIGMTSMDSLSESYKYVLSHKGTISVGGYVLPADPTNDTSNFAFRRRFIYELCQPIIGVSSDTGAELYTVSSGSTSFSVAIGESGNQAHKDACDNAVAYLNSLIKNPGNARVTSISGLEIIAEDNGEAPNPETGRYVYKYKLVIKDCNIEYMEDNESRYSEVTVDYNVELPDLKIVFLVENDQLPLAFTDYIFIASQAVRFRGMTGTVMGGVYAGDATSPSRTTGVVVENADMTFRSEKGTISSNKDIVVQNDAAGKASAKFESCNIWATNLYLKTTSTNKPDGNNVFLNIDANSNTHLADDVQFEARYSTANISGDFWGYGTGSPSSFHQGYSAINMNGKNSTLNVNNLKHLMIAGKAYLMYNPAGSVAENLLLPESLAMKGNQRYYVVPDEYLKVTWDGMDDDVLAAGGIVPSQPINTEVSVNPVFVLQKTEFDSKFFGSKFVDPLVPYVERTGKSKYRYCVLNFKSNKDAENYLRCLLDVNFYNTYFDSKGYGADTYRASRNNMAVMTNDYLKNVNSIVSVNTSGASVAATGLIFNYAAIDNISMGGTNSSDAAMAAELGLTPDEAAEKQSELYAMGNENPLFIVNVSDSCSKRYSILNHTLINYAEYSGTELQLQTEATPSAYWYGTDKWVITPDMYTKNVFDNLIDVSEVNANPYFTKTSPSSTTAAVMPDGEFVWIGAGNITVPSTARYGCIVATGNVTFESSAGFNGIVIANGVIYVNSSATYTNHVYESNSTYPGIREYLEQSNGGSLAKYFIPLQGTFNAGEKDVEDKLSNMKYLDLVTYSNWRKTVGE